MFSDCLAESGRSNLAFNLQRFATCREFRFRGAKLFSRKGREAVLLDRAPTTPLLRDWREWQVVRLAPQAWVRTHHSLPRVRARDPQFGRMRSMLSPECAYSPFVQVPSLLRLANSRLRRASRCHLPIRRASIALALQVQWRH